MKKLITFAIFIFCTNYISAQFGINAGYRTNGANNWEKYYANQDFLKSGFKVGIDYWFRLKATRIEFTPELAYTNFKSEVIQPWDDIINVKSQIYSLYLNTNIYFLDLENDCNCPTWSKSNDFFKKGIFFQITPGLNYFQNFVENPLLETEKVNDFVFSIGAGLGLDIGISNMVTVTPLVNYHYYFGATWDGLADQLGVDVENQEASETTNLQQIFLGLRLGVRLDQQNYGFR